VKILNASIQITSFFEQLKTAKARGLFLDYDGTLAPFRVERDQALPYPGVQDMLKNLLTDKTLRLVLITGRSVKDFLFLMDLKSSFEIWGSHGWERRKTDGTVEKGQLPALWNQALDRAFEDLKRKGWESHAERKFASVALHWRGFPQDEAKHMRYFIIERWSRLLGDYGLALQDFDGGIELRAPGHDKGEAVKTLLAEMGPNAMCAYLGDDRTDEDAFQAIRGKGLGVLVRENFVPTQADLWIKPPEELLEFLARWKSASGL
jgi:trehalose-phosphatase